MFKIFILCEVWFFLGGCLYFEGDGSFEKERI